MKNVEYILLQNRDVCSAVSIWHQEPIYFLLRQGAGWWCRCMEPPPGVAKVPATSLRCGLSWWQPPASAWLLAAATIYYVVVSVARVGALSCALCSLTWHQHCDTCTLCLAVANTNIANRIIVPILVDI